MLAGEMCDGSSEGDDLLLLARGRSPVVIEAPGPVLHFCCCHEVQDSDVLALVIIVFLATNKIMELDVFGCLIPLEKVGEQVSAHLASLKQGLHLDVEFDDIGAEFDHFLIQLSKGGPDEGDSCAS